MKSPGKLKDILVLVVEDEALVAMNLESMLEDIGCRIAGPAMRLDRAYALLDGASSLPQVAILDVNVGGQKVFPLAERLVELSIPFAFATGYGRAGIPEPFAARPVLQKPYSIDDIERVLIEALGL